MRMPVIHAISVLSLAVTATACRPDGNDHTVPPRAERTDAPISVSGCLTAGPGQKQFVLTASSAPLTSTAVRSTGTSPTFTYELVGGEDLARHLGREVTVHGRMDAEQDSAEFEQQRQDAVDTPTPRGETPTVRSTEEVEIEVRRLFVESVEGSSEDCRAD